MYVSYFLVVLTIKCAFKIFDEDIATQKVKND